MTSSPITIREADTIWHEEGGWFDARWLLEHTFEAGRVGYLYVIDGRIRLDDEPLGSRRGEGHRRGHP
jgi:hypothetical protein